MILSALSGITALLTPDWRAHLLAEYTGPLNPTQDNMMNVINDACMMRNPDLQADFRDRCNALVGASQSPSNTSSVNNALVQTAPDQLTFAGVTGTRTTASQLRVVGTVVQTRMEVLRASLNSPSRYAGFALHQNGSPVQGATGGAAGADDSIIPPFGIWVNTSYQAGDVNSTFLERGYNFKSGGVTIGADMRLLDDLVVGTAFSYLASDSYFDLSGGRSQTNSYTGTVYGTYYVIDNLHLDALASFGGTDYDTQRNIQYVIPGDVVNTKTFGSPGGEQYFVSFGTGYDYAYESFSLNPYFRFDYAGLQVDGYQESGGDGWAARFGTQNIQSLRTTLGTQASYAISTSFGVLLPRLRAEWVHEYKDNGRNITASFVGDPAAQIFNIVTQGPDRNYAIIGGGLSGTFAGGISAFISYDALVGYQNISSHRVVIGARLDF
ncbi:MAG: autotransporter outer membrane beta-barrel domain-containing protein [Gammaproteobacteria bacterium]